MTIIQERLEDIAGFGLPSSVSFTVPVMRSSADTSAIVAEDTHLFHLDNGELLTTDLDPGPATVRISGHSRVYRILIPDSATPVRLWPLLDALMPAPPEQWQTGFIRNGGGMARGVALTQAEMDARPEDPGTFYFITDSFTL